MKRLLVLGLLLTLAVLLTACAVAPNVAAPTPYVVGVSIQEAQRMIDSATSTAQAAQTQQAVATEQRRLTEEALNDAGTQVALVVTVAKVTQIAEVTHIAQTATVAALEVKHQQDAAAAQLAIQAQHDADARTADDAKAWRAFLLLFASVVAYIAARTFAAWLTMLKDVQHNIEWAKVEQARAQADIAKANALQAMTVQLPSGPHLITEAGYRPLVIIENAAPTQDVIPAPTNPNMAWSHRWRSALKMVVAWGIELGARDNAAPQFGERDLAGRDMPIVVNADGTPSVAGYRRIKAVLHAWGVWQVAGRDTVWGVGWSTERFYQRHELDTLPLPAFLEGEPPQVRVPAAVTQ